MGRPNPHYIERMSSKELEEEGPLFLTIKPVRGEPLMRELKENLQKMRDKNVIRHDAKILILSGSHGSEDGISGLTDKSPKNVDEGYAFYLEDCELLGFKPGPHKRSQRLPLRNWNGVPDITKPAEKDENFVQDILLLNMDIRVCNICYYYGQEEKLIQDIQKFQPDLISLSFCFSPNSDVSMMFRHHGIFSEMIVTHDIRCITGRPDAKLSRQQRQLISQIVSRSVKDCVFLTGSAGTGKTLMLSEALKIKLSMLKHRGTDIDIKIFVTTFGGWETELLDKYRKQYLVNIENINLTRINQLCGDLNVEFNYDNPQSTMNNVVMSLSEKYTDNLVILLCDEVFCGASSDWNKMKTCHNVVWLMAINPDGCSNMVPPTLENVLSEHLLIKYRNCVQIRQFYKWLISHTYIRRVYMDMSSDQELAPDQLPRGHTPIWIQPPRNATLIEMLERVLKIPELTEYNNNVTVLYYGEKDAGVMARCQELGWKYIDNANMYGVEDQVVILLNTDVLPEEITRGINMLIIVTNYSWVDDLQSAVDHKHWQCTKMKKCKYKTKLIEKRPWS